MGDAVLRPYHGGNPPRSDIIDFSSNLHPDSAPESVLRAVQDGVFSSGVYSDPQDWPLREFLSDIYGVGPEQLIVGPGSSTILYQLFSVLRPATVVLPVPCFSEYPHLASVFGSAVIECPLDARTGFALPPPPRLPEGSLVILSNPCNPTGRTASPEMLDEWRCAVERVRGWMILDEAYVDFLESESFPAPPPRLFSSPSVIVLRSPAKFFTLPGLRLGLGFLPVGLSGQVENFLPPWPLSAPSAAGLEAIHRLSAPVVQDRRRRIRTWSASFRRALDSIPSLTVYPTDVHFFLIRLSSDVLNAECLCRELVSRGVWIRPPTGMPTLTDRDFRISTRLPEENGRFLESVKAVLQTVPVSS